MSRRIAGAVAACVVLVVITVAATLSATGGNAAQAHAEATPKVSKADICTQAREVAKTTMDDASLSVEDWSALSVVARDAEQTEVAGALTDIAVALRSGPDYEAAATGVNRLNVLCTGSGS